KHPETSPQEGDIKSKPPAQVAATGGGGTNAASFRMHSRCLLLQNLQAMDELIVKSAKAASPWRNTPVSSVQRLSATLRSRFRYTATGVVTTQLKFPFIQEIPGSMDTA